MKVQDKITGKVYNALYECNRLGNKRLWIDGKLYSDKDFARKFNIISNFKYKLLK